MTDEKKIDHHLIVTKNGIPFEDQAEGIRLFKEACFVPLEHMKPEIPEDIHETAYDEADQFSDWYGCDDKMRKRLTEAFELAITAERGRWLRKFENCNKCGRIKLK